MSDSAAPKYLSPLITEAQQRAREAVRRQTPFDFKAVADAEMEDAVADG